MNVTSFHVSLDSQAPVTLPAEARSWPVPTLTAGTHVFTVAACNALCSPASLTYVVPDPVVPVPTPPPTPVPIPVPPASTCKDGSAVFPSGFVEWVYTKIGGSFSSNTDYKRLIAAGWTYVDGSAYRVRANYYNLQFRCGS